MSWLFHDKESNEDQEITHLAQHAAQLHGVPVEEVVDTVLDRDDDEEEDEKRPRRRVGVLVTLVCIGAVFGLGIIFLMRLANGADAAGPKETPPTSLSSPTPLVNGQLVGKYVSFSYPGQFDTVRTNTNMNDQAESYLIGSTSDYRREIAVQVENNVAQIAQDSGFVYRSDNPSVYTPTHIMVMGEPAVDMVKSDGTERTLYWAHGGMVIIISITSTNGTDNLAAFMTTVSSTLKWVQ